MKKAMNWVNGLANRTKSVIHCQAGQTMTEYAIIMACIVAAVIAVFAIFTPGLEAVITAVLASITAAI